MLKINIKEVNFVNLKMEKYFFLMLAVLLVLPLVNALVFQQNQVTDLKIPCTLEGYPCSTNAICNLTIVYPNSSYLLNNEAMTNLNTGDFNYSLSFIEIGDCYLTKVQCVDGIYNSTATFCITITQTGSELSVGQGIIMLIFVIALIFIFLLCLYGAIRLPWKHGRNEFGKVVSVNDLKYLKIFLFVLSYLLLIFIFGTMRGISANYLFMTGLSKFFDVLYWIMFSFLFPGLVLALIITIISILTNLKFKEAIERNVPLR